MDEALPPPTAVAARAGTTLASAGSAAVLPVHPGHPAHPDRQQEPPGEAHRYRRTRPRTRRRSSARFGRSARRRTRRRQIHAAPRGGPSVGAARQPTRRALYVTGEESAGQVRLRADRTGAVHERMYLAAESDLATILGHVEQVRPTLLIVDSVQTMLAADVDGVIGGVTQVKAVTSALTSLAKSSGVPVLLIGHVTKDGAVAGPTVPRASRRRGAALRRRQALDPPHGPRREEPIRRRRRGGLFRTHRRRHRRHQRSVRTVPPPPRRSGGGHRGHRDDGREAAAARRGAGARGAHPQPVATPRGERARHGARGDGACRARAPLRAGQARQLRRLCLDGGRHADDRTVRRPRAGSRGRVRSQGSTGARRHGDARRSRPGR